jgi:acylphosphatase
VPELNTRRVHVRVSGHVQGVFYRADCAERARALGLTGWVRNTPDGRVEAAFEGEPAAVDEMVAWCRTGSKLSRVDDVEVRDEPPEGRAGFRVIG